MEDQAWQAALEAQFVMGHCVPAAHLAPDRETIVAWSWDMSQVRQQLNVPLNDLWDDRVFALEMYGLARFGVYAAPVTEGDQGQVEEIPGWRDGPREPWGSVAIFPAGVLRLAALYGRPYVRVEDAPAVLAAHWRLVQFESAARLRGVWDETTWAREWPERWRHWQAWLAERDRDE